MSAEQLVPGNRWDLLAPAPPLPVAVVVTHFEQPAELARTLAGVARQTLAPAEVVVADDGSAQPPSVPPGVRLVRQDDLGNRAGAARDLGVAATTSPVLVLLDADTVPEPGFLAALTARVAACPDVLAVGRRRYADLSGDGRELPEPAWLAQGYADTADLLHADGRSFRYVISAVLACRRELYDDLDGFDPRFVGYGGEDWDLAYRAWNAGAVLVHEPGAVAWHDGPDFAGRTDDDGVPLTKDDETLRLAALVPEPSLRGVARPGALPDLLVDLPAADPRALAALLAADHRDLAVRTGGPVPAELADALRTDPWTADQRRRARGHLVLHEPVALTPDVPGAVLRLLTEQDLGRVHLRVGDRVVGTLTSTRAAGRARRHGDPGVVVQCFGETDVAVRPRRPRGDLQGFLAALGRGETD